MTIIQQSKGPALPVAANLAKKVVCNKPKKNPKMSKTIAINMSLNRSLYRLLQCPSEKKLLSSLGLEKKNYDLVTFCLQKNVFSLFNISPNQEYLVVCQEATFSMRHLKESYWLQLLVAMACSKRIDGFHIC